MLDASTRNAKDLAITLGAKAPCRAALGPSRGGGSARTNTTDNGIRVGLARC